EAEEHLRAIIGIYQRRKYQRGELLCLIQLGAAKLEQEQLDEAISSYQKALRLSQDFEEPRLEGIALGYLGMTSQLQGDNQSARDYYQRSIGLLRQTAEVAHCGLFTAFLG